MSNSRGFVSTGHKFETEQIVDREGEELIGSKTDFVIKSLVRSRKGKVELIVLHWYHVEARAC